MKRTRSSHIDAGDLLGLAEAATLPGEQRAHLESCSACQAESAQIDAVVRSMRADRAPEPPRDLVAAATGLFRPAPPRAVRVLELLGRLLGSERAPALAGALPAPVRGEGLVSRLAFAGESIQIHLELDEGPYGLRVTGQALPEPGVELPVLAWAESGGKILLEAPIGEHGQFLLGGLPVASFDLVFDLGERRLRLPIEPGGLT